MDELRFVRREDQALIVVNGADEEFRLVVDDTVLSELRHLAKRDRQAGKVRPREIQALIRAGKSRAQVAEETGLEEADVERFEEPVLAERRYILELAQAVPVRTDVNDDSDQHFGSVIAERLIGLGVDDSEWSSWKDDETGWMIGLDFVSHEVSHRAIWAFAHRKGTLAPVNSDAVNLSKQGEVGDRLIPKLRAVDSEEKTGRFDSDAFDHSQLPITDTDRDELQTAEQPAIADEAPERGATVEEAAPSLADANAEYARRKEIDHRAIKTDDSEEVDLSQTADLLDALRKRRGEREQSARKNDVKAEDAQPVQPAADPPAADESVATPPRSIWGAAGVTGQPATSPAPSSASAPPKLKPVVNAPSLDADKVEPKLDPEKSPRKGRASIPSWDDILFGTRSDEDPA
ncbi:DUF3071 domain-containing protein [Leucobacter coleopterorum]|uniref:DUF3071 domain-containing protein n=1 Tax=Leucobacter coleopterorum TaxID=2714933 RepID=A0ABX6JW63_9MICO|nr:septation protein SepH [Leucobacter coleopterorum]QIM18483.1 DUF3071 domain-containing protein [Leucobacter coleopterorum]